MLRVLILLIIAVLALTGCNNASKKTYYEISKSEVADSTPTPKSSAKPSVSPPINASVSPSPTPKSETGEEDDGDYPTPMNLLNSYAYALIDSINTGIFSTVEEYLLKDSNLYKMQKKLVYSLYEKGVTENLLSIEMVDENWESKEKCLVSTKEVVEIFYASGKSETNTYYWTYTMVYSNNKYYLSDIAKYNK